MIFNSLVWYQQYLEAVLRMISPGHRPEHPGHHGAQLHSTSHLLHRGQRSAKRWITLQASATIIPWLRLSVCDQDEVSPPLLFSSDYLVILPHCSFLLLCHLVLQCLIQEFRMLLAQAWKVCEVFTKFSWLFTSQEKSACFGLCSFSVHFPLLVCWSWWTLLELICSDLEMHV